MRWLCFLLFFSSSLAQAERLHSENWALQQDAFLISSVSIHTPIVGEELNIPEVGIMPPGYLAIQLKILKDPRVAPILEVAQLAYGHHPLSAPGIRKLREGKGKLLVECDRSPKMFEVILNAHCSFTYSKIYGFKEDMDFALVIRGSILKETIY